MLAIALLWLRSSATSGIHDPGTRTSHLFLYEPYALDAHRTASVAHAPGGPAMRTRAGLPCGLGGPAMRVPAVTPDGYDHRRAWT
jgi:hypothetical protein